VDSATIRGCRAKVKRCEELLHVLEDKWRSFLDDEPWPSRIEHDAESRWYTVYFNFTTPPPEALGVVVGELAHDLRSALDHLAWREAVEHLNREPTNDEAGVIKYPLAWNEGDFRSAQVLRYLSKDTAALMKRHQPYERPDSKEAASLGVVHWFNNLDKHRAVHVTAASAPGTFVMEQLFIAKRRDVQIAAVQPHLPPSQRLTGDTKIVSVRFEPEGVDPQMSVEGEPPFQPSFGELPSELAGADVRLSIKTVGEIVNDFADLVP
jgi:hypothetical protein